MFYICFVDGRLSLDKAVLDLEHLEIRLEKVCLEKRLIYIANLYKTYINISLIREIMS